MNPRDLDYKKALVERRVFNMREKHTDIFCMQVSYSQKTVKVSAFSECFLFYFLFFFFIPPGLKAKARASPTRQGTLLVAMM